MVIGSIQELYELSGFKVSSDILFLAFQFRWNVNQVEIGQSESPHVFLTLSTFLVMQATDLHRHFIDHVTIPSPRGPEFGVLKRVEDVSSSYLLYSYFNAVWLDLNEANFRLHEFYSHSLSRSIVGLLVGIWSSGD